MPPLYSFQSFVGGYILCSAPLRLCLLIHKKTLSFPLKYKAPSFGFHHYCLWSRHQEPLLELKIRAQTPLCISITMISISPQSNGCLWWIKGRFWMRKCKRKSTLIHFKKLSQYSFNHSCLPSSRICSLKMWYFPSHRLLCVCSHRWGLPVIPTFLQVLNLLNWPLHQAVSPMNWLTLLFP